MQNFRSKKSTVTSKDIMVIVGETNAGKTVLLRSLNSVKKQCYQPSCIM